MQPLIGKSNRYAAALSPLATAVLGSFVAGWWLAGKRERSAPIQAKAAVTPTPSPERHFGLPAGESGEQDSVDRSSRESFPASDAPAW